MNKYWFKKRKGFFSKDLGWGWIPISWEGWLMILIFACLIILSVYYFNLASATIWQGLSFLFTLIVIIFIFGYIADKKSSDPVIFKKK